MSFREKIAWLSLVGIAIAFGGYFGALLLYPGPARGLMPYSFAMLSGAIVVQTVLMAIGATVIAARDPGEARAPADERDRQIAMRASARAYMVLLPAVLAACATIHFGFGRAAMLNAVLGAIVIAELVRCALEIFGYRRGFA